MKKQFMSVVVVLLCVAMIAGALVVGTAAATAAPKIAACNISFADANYFVFAVDTDADAKVYVWTNADDVYTENAAAVLNADGTVDVEGVEYVAYTYKVAAKNLADTFYAATYVDGEFGVALKYSAIQYAYNVKNETENEKMVALINAMLDYGAAAQLYWGHNTGALANATWHSIAVTAGHLEDHTTAGLYVAGAEVTLIAAAADEAGVPFARWIDKEGNEVATEPTFVLTVTADAEYTPVYEAAPVEPDVPEEPEWPEASVGLEMDFDEEMGEAFVVSIGECEDTEIVIPAEYEGFPVVSIEASAFQSCDIDTLYIPNTVVNIAAKAFYKAAVANVYYDGTAAEWEENVTVGRNNAGLTDAEFFFKTVKYTVNFVVNGEVVATQKVEEGTAAAAPAVTAPEGYEFAWDKDFSVVTSDMTVTAVVSKAVSGPAFVVEETSAVAGETVQVRVLVKNNPGISGAKLWVEYAEGLTLVAADLGPAFAVIDYTAPASLTLNPCPFNWDTLDQESHENGVVIVLTFAVADTAAGDLDVTVSYPSGSVFDVEMNDVNPECVNGKVTVK